MENGHANDAKAYVWKFILKGILCTVIQIHKKLMVLIRVQTNKSQQNTGMKNRRHYSFVGVPLQILVIVSLKYISSADKCVLCDKTKI